MINQCRCGTELTAKTAIYLDAFNKKTLRHPVCKECYERTIRQKAVFKRSKTVQFDPEHSDAQYNGIPEE